MGVQEIIDQWRPVLDRLAGVGRKVLDVCGGCGHEVDQWDEGHRCPPGGGGPNERGGNFWEGGKFYLVRCYVCAPDRGRENYLPAAASGRCAWCGAGPNG